MRMQIDSDGTQRALQPGRDRIADRGVAAPVEARAAVARRRVGLDGTSRYCV